MGSCKHGQKMTSKHKPAPCAPTSDSTRPVCMLWLILLSHFGPKCHNYTQGQLSDRCCRSALTCKGGTLPILGIPMQGPALTDGGCSVGQKWPCGYPLGPIDHPEKTGRDRPTLPFLCGVWRSCDLENLTRYLRVLELSIVFAIKAKQHKTT